MIELAFLAHIVKKNKEAIKKRFNIIAMYSVITLILLLTAVCLWVDPIAEIVYGASKKVDLKYTENSAVLALCELSLVEILFAMTWQSIKGWKDFEMITAKLGHDPARMKITLEEMQDKLERLTRIMCICCLVINFLLVITTVVFIWIIYTDDDQQNNNDMLPIWLETCFEATASLFLIGYFVLCCVAYYWFRVKYANKKTELSKVLFLIGVLALQTFLILADWVLDYLFIYCQNCKTS